MLFYSLFKLLTAIRPKIDLPKIDSLLYFGNISILSLDRFKEKVDKVTPKEYRNDLINQIYVNASICSRKYSRYIDAQTLFIFGVFFWLMFALLVLLSR